MNTALDIAAYLVKLSTEIGEPLTNMKLQKLLYYSYAWFSVETKGGKLFNEPIYAWKYGPVIPVVYDAYKEYGADNIKEVKGSTTSEVDSFSQSLVEDVYKVYGNKNAIELMNLTHSESPWIDSFDPTVSPKEISFEKIFKYYTDKKQISEG